MDSRSAAGVRRAVFSLLLLVTTVGGCTVAYGVVTHFTGPAALPDIPADQLLRRVDRRYNSITSLQAEFVETYSNGPQTRTESGTMYLRKPGRMRWEYGPPQPKLFLVDGHNVWLYVAGDDQAEKTPLKDSSDLRTPLRFLLGHSELAKELSDVSYGGLNPLLPGDAVVRGVPRHLSDQYSELLLEIAPDYAINRIVVHAIDGSQTDFRLRDIRVNPNLSPALFRFKPPRHVRVVAGTLSPTVE